MKEQPLELECACLAMRQAARMVTQFYGAELHGRLEIPQFGLLSVHRSHAAQQPVGPRTHAQLGQDDALPQPQAHGEERLDRTLRIRRSPRARLPTHRRWQTAPPRRPPTMEASPGKIPRRHGPPPMGRPVVDARQHRSSLERKITDRTRSLRDAQATPQCSPPSPCPQILTLALPPCLCDSVVEKSPRRASHPSALSAPSASLR